MKHILYYAKITADNRVIFDDIAESVFYSDRMTIRYIKNSQEQGYIYRAGFDNLLTYKGKTVLAVLVLFINNEWLLEIIV